MLKRAVFALSLSLHLLLAGCQPQPQLQPQPQPQPQQREYEALCRPDVSRNQCSPGDLELGLPKCTKARETIAGCANFVMMESIRQKRLGRQAFVPPLLPYNPPSQAPIALSANDAAGNDRVIHVDTMNADAYWWSASKAESLVTDLLGEYEVKSERYLLSYDSSNAKVSDARVSKAIAQLEAMREPLARAVAAGAPMVAFYSEAAKQPQDEFELMAREIVASTNPGDPYLRLGADLAIKMQRVHNGFVLPADRARWAVTKFEELSKRVNQPLAYAFALRKSARAEEARASRRVTRLESSQQGSPSQQDRLRARGGNCSCAGGNVCYGPRGGRYCITSGGNKRYGI